MEARVLSFRNHKNSLSIKNNSKSTTLSILKNSLDCVHLTFFWFLLELATIAERENIKPL